MRGSRRNRRLSDSLALSRFVCRRERARRPGSPPSLTLIHPADRYVVEGRPMYAPLANGKETARAILAAGQ
jgi:hypothetical protein